jgi:hypothetical protein
VYIKEGGNINTKSVGDFLEEEKEDLTRLSDIVKLLNTKYQKQVVILIDEYDRPVLNLLNKPEEAEDLRLKFRDFYS